MAPEFTDFDEVDTSALLSAQAKTAMTLEDLGGVPLNLDAKNRARAHDAFASVLSPILTDEQKKKAVLTLRVPEAVKHLAGMLSQYDWDYVEQAKELRGYVVANLLEESKHPDAKIRLRSLELLGKLTEVGSFTERIQVTKIDATADELTDRIKAKLASLMPKVIEVETVVPKES